VLIVTAPIRVAAPKAGISAEGSTRPVLKAVRRLSPPR
jgi:hypothetical protein